MAAAAAARRQLVAQIAEAEAMLAQREAELTAAQVALQAVDSQLGDTQSRVNEGAAEVAQLDKLLPLLSLAEQVAVAAAQLRTTPVGYPPTPGHSAKDDADRAVRAIAEARRAREQVTAALQEAAQAVSAGSAQVAEARRLVASLSEEIEQRRNALAGLRQQLGAAIAANADTGNGTVVHALTAEAGDVAPASPLALSDIPAPYLDLYQHEAAVCPGLSWTVLAAIGSIETAHGRSSASGVHSGANPAGAMGPMQFLGPTWSAYGVDGNGDGAVDVYDPADAVAGAANYLCANGGGHLATLAAALWNYNHADWYVASVIQLAGAYGGGGLEPATGPVDAARLVENPNLILSPAARGDILGNLADQRVVGLLAAAAMHHRVTISVIKTGHDQLVHGTDRVSNHYACDGCQGRALDIVEVDGAPVTASNAAALELALSVLTADPPLRPDEFGSPWPELVRFPGGFSDGDHLDHLHAGWGPVVELR